MSFLWGFIMFFICHTVANIFANNLYCYIQEKKSKEVNRYAIKQYLTKSAISFVVYIAIFIVAITVEAFSEHISAILIGNGIGFITAFIHFRQMADDNYIKQKAKNEWNSCNSMTFEEKRKKLSMQNPIKETTKEENVFSISLFIKSEFLYGRLADIKVVTDGINKTFYDKATNRIYISDEDNETEDSFNEALLICFQDAICVEQRIRKDSISTAPSKELDKFSSLEEAEKWEYEMRNNITPESFFEIQHEMPGFGFPTDKEKIDPIGDFNKLIERRNAGEELSVAEKSKIIFSKIFGSYGENIDLNSAEEDCLKLLKNVESLKPEDKSDDKVFIKWYKSWQMANVLLGTIYGYKKEYIKSAYHFMASGHNDHFLSMGALVLKMPYNGFINYVLKQIPKTHIVKANYEGCGFTKENPMGACNQISATSLQPTFANFIITRMCGLNGEVIVAIKDGFAINGYLKRVGSCGPNINGNGIIDKYKALIIDKEYNLKEIELYFDGYFEEINFGPDFEKKECKIPNGFTIRPTCLNDMHLKYIDSDGNELKR